MGIDILPYIYNAFNIQFNPFHVAMLLQSASICSQVHNYSQLENNRENSYPTIKLFYIIPVSLNLRQLCPRIPHEMLKMPHYKLHQKMPRKSSILPELGQPATKTRARIHSLLFFDFEMQASFMHK